MTRIQDRHASGSFQTSKEALYAGGRKYESIAKDIIVPSWVLETQLLVSDGLPLIVIVIV